MYRLEGYLPGRDVHAATMKTSMIDLPSELISTIATYLPDPSILAFRQAHSHLERATLSYFGIHLFRKKGYMLTSPSLSTLQHIADHPELRKYVQHVWFNPDLYTWVHPECAPDPQESPDPENPNSVLELLSPSDRRKFEAYEECMQDYANLLRDAGAELASKFINAFAKLPNLEVLGMRRSEDHAPWGWSKLRDAVGEDPRVLGPMPWGPVFWLPEATRLFIALIKAVAATEHLKVRRLYTDVVALDSVRLDLLPQEMLDQACASIWYLETNVTRAWGNGAHYRKLLGDTEYGDGLVSLLKATPNLKELGLQIFPDRRQKAPGHQPVSFRDSYAYLCFAKAVQNVQFSHVTRIKLERITASPALLLAFLSPSAHCLASLKVRRARLVGDESIAGRRPWQTVFEFLRDSCPQLEHILLHHSFQEHGVISFVEGLPAPGEPVNSERFTLRAHGREAVHAKLAHVVERHWYHEHTPRYETIEEWHTDTSDEE